LSAHFSPGWCTCCSAAQIVGVLRNRSPPGEILYRRVGTFAEIVAEAKARTLSAALDLL
jgi:hypothetical protein